MTDPEQAALAALVAWREMEKAEETHRLKSDWPAYHYRLLDTARDLRAAADRLIAERAAAVSR